VLERVAARGHRMTESVEVEGELSIAG
jgi:hypothetical protein